MSKQHMLATGSMGVAGVLLATLGALGAWRWFAVGTAILLSALAVLAISARSQMGGVSRHVLATERIGKDVAGRVEASRQRLERIESGMQAVSTTVVGAAERGARAERRLLSTHEAARLALETAAHDFHAEARYAAGRHGDLLSLLARNHEAVEAMIEQLARSSDATMSESAERLAIGERRLLTTLEVLRVAVEDGLQAMRTDAAHEAVNLGELVLSVQSGVVVAAESMGQVRQDIEVGKSLVEDRLARAIQLLEVAAARYGALKRELLQLGRSSRGLEKNYADLNAAYEVVVYEVVQPVSELLGSIEDRRGVPISESVLRIERALDDVHTRLGALAENPRAGVQEPALAAEDGADDAEPVNSIDGKLVIAELEQRLRDSVLRRRQDRLTPSFHEQYSDMRRQVDRAVVTDPEGWHPYRQTKRKLRNYEFAASHGFHVPTIYRTWAALEDIDLAGLPERFVLKSDFGASGHGVLLLERVGEDMYRRLDRRDVLLDVEQVRSYLRSRVERGDIEGPYFAEALLVSANDELVPEDVKIYACYGEIAQVMLRRAAGVSGKTRATFRYLGPDGTDLGRVVSNRDIDQTIPAPDSLGDMLAAARHLSRAMGTPFCRVDLYETQGGIVVGELTLTPGGPQTYEPHHDAAMGEKWRDGVLARDIDLSRGRPFGRLYGREEQVWLYRPDHVSRSDEPGAWARTVVDCASWCMTQGAGGRSLDGGGLDDGGMSEPGERVQF